MKTAVEFRNEHLGKAIDVDGAYGAQCVDLFKKCCYLAGKGAFALGGSGYADEIVHRFDALGLGTYFDLVQLSNAQYGDWIVWDKYSKEAPDSHVAMFVGWDGSNRVVVLGQNQFGKSAANEGSISTSGIIGVLRLKEWFIPGVTTTTPNGADQIIYPGSKVTIPGVYAVTHIDVANNKIGSTSLTGAVTQSYHWIDATPCNEVNGSGTMTGDQIFKVGESFAIPGTFNVLAIDVATDAVKVHIGNGDVWLKASECYEVSDN